MKDRSSNKLAYNILQLQNLVKRDHGSYYDEFHLQHRHYKSLMELFKLKPQDYNPNLESLVMFLAQVSSFYKEDLEYFPEELMSILKEYQNVLDPCMRMCFCKALILMRNRGLMAPTDLMKLFFELLRCRDKVLRNHLQVFIISDVKKLNAKHKNAKVNSVLQNFMFKMLSDHNATAAKMSLDITIELYRRHIWRDAKTVNAIATACFSNVNKILVAAHRFFLGVDEEEEKDSSDSENDTPTVAEVMQANKVNKKSRRRMGILNRTKRVLKNSKNKKKEYFDFSAIHLLHDPQEMAEKLLKYLEGMNEKYEIKVLVMNLISRLVGVHKLILLNFYPLLVRFTKPHQRDVTKILMFAAQAAHEYVPPDVIDPLLKAIAYNFITERNSAEVITVGINAVREICIRCPLSIDQDLLQDLVQYQKYKNKNVAMAARSLIQLFRQINPKLLQRKYRNKPTESTKDLKPLEYGALDAKSYIPGTEALTVDPPVDDANAVEEEIADESDGSWVDVSHSDDEYLQLGSDSDEENDKGASCSKTLDETSKATSNPSIIANEVNSENVDSEKKSSTTEVSISEVKITDDKEKAMTVSHSRILSQEEFKKLKVIQIAKKVQFAKAKKRKLEDDNAGTAEVERGELVSLREIEKLHKRPRPNKETRLATILEGREGREKFGSKKKKKTSCSKTQKQHKKSKPFMMIKHKLRAKVKRSFKDKQVSLRNALLKHKRNK